MRIIGGEEGRYIGPDCIKCDKAEIEQAGKADLDIEPHPHQHEEADQQEHLPHEIPGIERKQRKQHEGDGKRGDPQGPPRSGRHLGDPRLERWLDHVVEHRRDRPDDEQQHRPLRLHAGIGVDEVMQRLGGPGVGEHRPYQLLEEPGHAARHQPTRQRPAQPAGQFDQQRAGGCHSAAEQQQGGYALGEGRPGEGEEFVERRIEGDENRPQIDEAHGDRQDRHHRCRQKPRRRPRQHRLPGARKEVPPGHDDTGGRQHQRRAWHSPASARRR